MEIKQLAEAKAFDATKMKKNLLFDSPHLFFDLYCLEPGQAQKVHAHDGSDKVYVVMEGRATFTVGDEEATLAAGTAVIARSGEPHGVRNDTTECLVVLVTMAPRPTA